VKFENRTRRYGWDAGRRFVAGFSGRFWRIMASLPLPARFAALPFCAIL